LLRVSFPIALLLSAGALVAADPPFAEYVPADTKILIGVEVRTIMISDWGKALVEQMKSASGDAWTKELPLKGFDPLQDVDQVWIASSSVDQKASPLVILRGRFDKSHLPAAIGRYHAVPLIPLDAKREHLMALMDPYTIFSGDRATVERAIDRRGLKSVDAHLATASTALCSRYWVWAVADGLDGVSAAKSATQGLEGVSGFEFGLSVNRDLDVAAQLHMRTAQDAQKMSALVAMLQAAAKGQPNGASQMNVESHLTDKTLDVSLRVPEDELRRAWDQQRAVIAQSLSQLPQQIAAARAGKPFSPIAVPPQTTAAAPGPANASQARHAPVARQSRILVDEDGNTVQVTLPGR
jgi:hypothetical protein